MSVSFIELPVLVRLPDTLDLSEYSAELFPSWLKKWRSELSLLCKGWYKDININAFNLRLYQHYCVLRSFEVQTWHPLIVSDVGVNYQRWAWQTPRRNPSQKRLREYQAAPDILLCAPLGFVCYGDLQKLVQQILSISSIIFLPGKHD